jgi:F0F1-type ATP synthase assembly protein I
MPDANTQEHPRPTGRRKHPPDLIPREFLGIIAVWSVIPAYLIAGAFLGWLLDRWLNTWPFGMAIGLIFALVLAVRDVIRLRKTL